MTGSIRRPSDAEARAGPPRPQKVNDDDEDDYARRRIDGCITVRLTASHIPQIVRGHMERVACKHESYWLKPIWVNGPRLRMLRGACAVSKSAVTHFASASGHSGRRFYLLARRFGATLTVGRVTVAVYVERRHGVHEIPAPETSYALAK